MKALTIIVLVAMAAGAAIGIYSTIKMVEYDVVVGVPVGGVVNESAAQHNCAVFSSDVWGSEASYEKSGSQVVYHLRSPRFLRRAITDALLGK